MEEHYVSVGSILKPHGLNGELKARLKYNLINARNYPGHFFIIAEGKYIPYFVNKLVISAPFRVLIKFEELNMREDVLQLGKTALYITESKFSEYFERATDDYFRLSGYKASDKTYGILGEIEEVIEMPAQYIAIVVHENGKEILIPLVEDFIYQINDDEQKIAFRLPAGLIELYLES